MNVLLEAPPSEQSVHVAVRMPMPLQLLSSVMLLCRSRNEWE